MDLTDEQWVILEPLIPETPPRADGKGRSRLNSRNMMVGILWALKTGAAWQVYPTDTPPRLCSFRTRDSWSR